MDKITKVTIATGAFGVLASLAVATGTLKASFRVLAISSLLAFPMVAVGQMVADNRAERRVREVKGELDAVVKQNQELQKLALANKQLSERLDTLSVQLSQAQKELTEHSEIRRQSLEQIYSQSLSIEALNVENQKLLRQVEEYEESYTSELEREIEQGIQGYKDSHKAQLEAKYRSVFDEAISLIVEARKLPEEYKLWGEQVADRLNEQKGWIRGQVVAFNSAIDEEKSDYEREKAVYLSEIELLREKVARLQQRLAGDLVEPQYGQFGYQWDARIVDDVARYVWSKLQVPLFVKGYKINPDGSAEGGYGYSRSQSIEALVADLNRISADIAKGMGIYEISSIRKHELSDLLIIQWRRERPKPLKDDEIYRIAEPASACTKLIREATNHKKGGKPTLRIMGATGEGKGIIARALLADWVKSESGEIWLSDPMDGSDEDRWEVPKAAKSSREARELLKQFKREFENRKDKSSTRKETHILALFDEFDKEHPREDKDLVKSIWTAIRHHNMRLILMGQSSEVGSNGWQWDEMKNCACVFVKSGITTAIKHAKDLGLSRAIANQLEAQNDLIKNWLESKNEGLDAANQYRFGLLVCGDKAKFVEFPPAYKGRIENDKASIVSYPWESIQGDSKPALAESRVCPGCGEKLRKSGSRLRCDNSAHTKAMGKKSFPISEQN